MDYIPEPLLMEVLLRLPLVALYRFKVVCKNWLSLIESISPIASWAFVSRMDYYCSKRDPVQAHELLTDLHCGDLKCPIPNRSDEDMHYRIMGVSNGLVLYEWKMMGGGSKSRERGMNWGVCSPVTRQCVVLPPCISEHHLLDSCGFLTQMKDGVVTSYTVVKYPLMLRRFEVFPSGTGEWKVYAASNLFYCFAGLYSAPIDLDGILHWLNSLYGIFAYDPHRNPDLVRRISLPTDRDNSKAGRFGMCGTHDGHLRYLESAALSLSVWVLNDYGCGDNWLLQHRVSYVNILKDVRHEYKTLKKKIKLHPISFHPLDPDVVYLGCDHVFVSYNMRQRKFQVLKTFRAIRNGKRAYRWERAFCLVIPASPQSLPSSDSRVNDSY